MAQYKERDYTSFAIMTDSSSDIEDALVDNFQNFL